MKVWAVITQKGGSGKTTIALHLAIMAEAHGLSTAVIDIDPQQSAVRWARIRDQESPRVLPALASEVNRTLTDLRRQQTDLAIIDTSPRANKECLEIARIADLIIVPVRPSILDLPAVQDTLQMLKAANRLDRVAIVLNSVATSTNESRDANSVLKNMGHLVPVQLGERVDYRRALTGGKGVTEFAPGSRAAQEIEGLYEALAKRSD